MADNIQRGEDGLPITAEKELAAMEKLFGDEKYQIKEPSGFLRPARKGIVNPDFITRTLEEFVRRVHVFRASAKKIIPPNANGAFFDALRAKNAAAEGILNMALSIEIKQLNEMLNILQNSARNISIAALQPFVKALYKSLIRIYYLEPEYASSCLMDAYRLAADRFAPFSAEVLRESTMAAIQEIKYIYSKIFPATYPLVLRMTSPVMLTEHDLFYKNGSKVLGWLGVEPDEIIFPSEEEEPTGPYSLSESEPVNEPKEEPAPIPEGVAKGLEMLERLFPGAGWEKILKFPEERADFAPYLAKPLQLSDTFLQLNPENPLHFAMILIVILAELFQGLRVVAFAYANEENNIYTILDDWALYVANVFDRTFGDDLKAYSHQVYTQADFARSGYAARLMGNVFSIIRQYFLPFYDMRFYPFQKTTVDRLPALYPRVSALCKMLDKSLVPRAPGDTEFLEATNASKLYRFDIPNTASRHLDALFGGQRSRRRTNKALIQCCSSILAVLDWWINDAGSPAYKARSSIIYRTALEDSLVPSFTVDARTDTEEIFKKSLKKDSAPS